MGEAGRRMLCARDTLNRGPPFITFLGGGDGLLIAAALGEALGEAPGGDALGGGPLGGGGVAGGFGATFGFLYEPTGGLLGGTGAARWLRSVSTESDVL